MRCDDSTFVMPSPTGRLALPAGFRPLPEAMTIVSGPLWKSSDNVIPTVKKDDEVDEQLQADSKSKR